MVDIADGIAGSDVRNTEITGRDTISDNNGDDGNGEHKDTVLVISNETEVRKVRT